MERKYMLILTRDPSGDETEPYTSKKFVTDFNINEKVISYTGSEYGEKSHFAADIFKTITVKQYPGTQTRRNVMTEQPSETKTCSSVENILTDLITCLDKEALDEIKSAKKEDLIMHHFGLGTFIRNRYQLWTPQAAQILNELECPHPDDASPAILDKLH